MSKILVFGRQNPDTNVVGAAITFSRSQNELGKEIEAVALGISNGETQYTLDHFQLSAPRVVELARTENANVMLVDHNEFQRSISGTDEVSILVIVDHHRIINFEIANPLYYRAEPAGCISTIILKLYKENQVTIPKEVARIMLSIITSDTLLLKSLICTSEDEAAAKELVAIAEVNLNTYRLEMLKAGTNLGDKSAVVLLDLGAKSLPMGSSSVRIAQVNTVDLNEVIDQQVELEAAMEDEMKTNGYDLFVSVVTNVLDSDSELLVTGEGGERVEETFQTTLINNRASLKGVVSHRKQVAPQLTAVFG